MNKQIAKTYPMHCIAGMLLAIPVMLITLYVAMIFPLSAFWVVVLAIPALLGLALYLIRQKMLGDPIKIKNSAVYGSLCGLSGFLALAIWLAIGQVLEFLRPGLGILGQWIGPVIAGGMIGSLCLFVERWIDPHCSA